MPFLRTTNLTKASVAHAIAQRHAYRVWDEKVPGLCLRILPTGRKIYELSSKGRHVSLGAHPDLSPREARRRAKAERQAFDLTNFILDAANHWQGVPAPTPSPSVGSGVTLNAGKVIARIKQAKTPKARSAQAA